MAKKQTATEIVNNPNDGIEPQSAVKDQSKPPVSSHNSDNDLKSYVARIEALEGDKAVILADISEVYQEAKDVGYNTKVLRRLISIRRMTDEERREEESLLDIYRDALGMDRVLPLFREKDGEEEKKDA